MYIINLNSEPSMSSVNYKINAECNQLKNCKIMFKNTLDYNTKFYFECSNKHIFNIK